jgi:hypothetical protein
MFRKLVAILVLIPTVAWADYPSQKLTSAADIAKRVGRFEKDMRILGFTGKVISCGPVVESRITKYRSLFAASCKVGVGDRQVGFTVCDDDMVGNFAMSTTGGSTEEDLATFAEGNCIAA